MGVNTGSEQASNTSDGFLFSMPFQKTSMLFYDRMNVTNISRNFFETGQQWLLQLIKLLVILSFTHSMNESATFSCLLMKLSIYL